MIVWTIWSFPAECLVISCRIASCHPIIWRRPPSKWQARQLARQLFHELILDEQKRAVYDHGVPPELERLKQYILFNLHRPRAAACSASIFTRRR